MDIKDLKNRFIDTIKEVSDITSIPISEVTREDYIRISVDCGLEGRLNKEELNALGGFSFLKELVFQTKKLSREIAEEEKVKVTRQIKDNIIDKFIELTEKSGFLPTIQELEDNEVSKKMINTYFGNYQLLFSEAEKVHGDTLSEFITEHAFGDSNRKNVENILKKYNKFIITTCVSGKFVDKDFLNSIKNYAKREKAGILVLPCQDVSRRNKEWIVTGKHKL